MSICPLSFIRLSFTVVDTEGDGRLLAAHPTVVPVESAVERFFFRLTVELERPAAFSLALSSPTDTIVPSRTARLLAVFLAGWGNLVAIEDGRTSLTTETVDLAFLDRLGPA
jgi:hypothetical protein